MPINLDMVETRCDMRDGFERHDGGLQGQSIVFAFIVVDKEDLEDFIRQKTWFCCLMVLGQKQKIERKKNRECSLYTREKEEETKKKEGARS